MGLKHTFMAVTGGALFAVMLVLNLASMPGFNAPANKLDGFIVGWPTTNSAARPQGYPHVLSSWTDTLAVITGTGSDTSGYFDLRALGTVVFTGVDTSADDSVAYTAYLWTAARNQFRDNPLKLVWNDWVLADSLVITASGKVIWNITASAIPVHEYGLITVTGADANKKVSPSLVKAAFSGAQ